MLQTRQYSRRTNVEASPATSLAKLTRHVNAMKRTETRWPMAQPVPSIPDEKLVGDSDFEKGTTTKEKCRSTPHWISFSGPHEVHRSWAAGFPAPSTTPNDGTEEGRCRARVTKLGAINRNRCSWWYRTPGPQEHPRPRNPSAQPEDPGHRRS